MFNPYVTPLIGDLVMPWILWRFVWILPVCFNHRVGALWPNRLAGWLGAPGVAQTKPVYGALGVVVAASLLLDPMIGQNVQDVQNEPRTPIISQHRHAFLPVCKN